MTAAGCISLAGRVDRRGRVRIKLDGGGAARLSLAAGTHSVLQPVLAYYTDTWSSVATPPQVRLHRNDGAELRVLEGNKARGARRLSTVSPSSCG